MLRKHIVESPFQIQMRVTDERNQSVAAFTFEYKSFPDMKAALKKVIPVLLTKGIFSAQQLEFEFDLDGVKMQRSDVPGGVVLNWGKAA